MIIELGHFSVIVALVLSVFGMASAALALKTRNPDWARSGRMALTLIFVLLAIGMLALIYSFIVRDFSVLYVANNSNSETPIFLYGISRLGVAMKVHSYSGFLSFRCLAPWLSGYIGAHSPRLWPYLIAVECAIIFGFLCLIVFLSSPFERLLPVPMDGKDLNPLLQDPAMVMHPPMLYMGYVGFSIPFSFAMAALFSGRLGEEWIKVTQRWTTFAWMCLTTGILLGGYWAYYELGWGGYWGWDPVENAVVHALVSGHCLSAFCLGTREAENVQSLELVSDHCDIFAIANWNLLGSQWSTDVCAFLCHRPRARLVYFNIRRQCYWHCLWSPHSPIG